MNIHKNARLTPLGRERIVRQVESGQTPAAVSETAGVCPRTVRGGLSVIVAKDWRGCKIAHPGRIGCGDRRRRRSSRRSNGYAATAGQESRSLRRNCPTGSIATIGIGHMVASRPTRENIQKRHTIAVYSQKLYFDYAVGGKPLKRLTK
jgi:hypothetical protein